MSRADNAIIAKVRAMYGRRLTTADYDMLMKMGSVADIATYLKSNTHYRDVLGNLDEHSAHRGRLEAQLRTLKYQQYTRLVRYHFSKSGDFYHFVFLREEIEQIIVVLRHLGAGGEEEYHPGYPSVLEGSCSYNLAALCRARDFRELLQVLDRTPYEAILRRHTPKIIDKKPQIDLVTCERELKTYYFKTILNQIRKSFSGKSRQALEQVFLAEIDADNLSGAYRLRRFFHETPKEIESAMLPFSTPSEKLIKRISEAPPGELDRLLTDAGLLSRPTVDDDGIKMATQHQRSKSSRLGLRYSIHPSVVLVSYIIQLELETENVVNIIEAIRYSLPPQEVRKLLVL